MKKNSSKPVSVRLGIIGVGNMGKHHARSIMDGKVPRCKLAAICDSDAEKLKEYPDTKTFSDASELIQSGEIDAVLVATPHYSHTPIGIEALKKGLHVLMEKPISVHKEDCEKLIAAHKNKRQVFAAMFNQRTDPYYRKIREMIRSGQLGKLQRVQWTVTNWFRSQAYYNSCGWRATWAGEGGGVLLNQCVHNIDLFQWIFGMPRKVRAICRMGRYHKIEVEDEVTAFFEYDDGMTAVLTTSTGEAPGVNRLEIAGDAGRLTLEGQELAFVKNEMPTSEYLNATEEGYEPPRTWNVKIPIQNHGQQHVGILRNFVAAILDGEALIAPAKEGIHSVELVNACYLSSDRDASIRLPVSGKVYKKLIEKFAQKSSFVKKTSRYHGGDANYLVKS